MEALKTATPASAAAAASVPTSGTTPAARVTAMLTQPLVGDYWLLPRIPGRPGECVGPATMTGFLKGSPATCVPGMGAIPVYGT
ncbi:hypothetical protein GCM10029964_007300 [Kibdelosporangium lantanae]